MTSSRDFTIPQLGGELLEGSTSVIAPIDENLALETLEGVVAEANRYGNDSQLGSVGFSRNAFVALTAKNETRVRQLGQDLQDRFQRVCTLAAVYQAKAKQLASRPEAKQ